MCEGKARLGISQLVEVMETHYIWRLKMALGVLVTFPAPSYFIVKLGGGQWSHKGCVGTGDAHSAI